MPVYNKMYRNPTCGDSHYAGIPVCIRTDDCRVCHKWECQEAEGHVRLGIDTDDGDFLPVADIRGSH